MKFTVSSTAMANKLAAMAKVMNNKPALPILSTFMLGTARWILQDRREQAKCALQHPPCWRQ